MSPRAAKSKVAAEEPRPEPTHDEIASRAYEIHISGEGADELGDWLQAEKELTVQAA
jgi:hypothetical protein